MIAEVIHSPTEFFVKQTEQTGVGYSVVIVGIAGLMLGGSIIISAFAALGNTSSDAIIYYVIGNLITAGMVVALIYLLWLFYAGSIHTFSTYVFGTSGEFRELLIVIGWGFIGLGFAGAISLIFEGGILLLSVEPTVTIPVIGLKITTLFQFVNNILFLWTCYLWVTGVRVATSNGLKRSVLLVVLPVSFSLFVSYIPSMYT
ncbi:YIP1 family protein [Haloarcula japonica]|uniref:YIP1 family protein n=1 Tax=Haloarcula japonica TaxID=29282 RepID=UPI0039F65B51